MNLSNSYSSAGILPRKLLKMKESCISTDGNILPIHFQLCPTNKCNLNCSFCSCAQREKDQELSFEEIQELIQDFSGLGAKAVTITGGGEPCCHPFLNEILKVLVKYGIKSGLVTNGLKLRDISNLPLLTWCRVSCSDDRNVDQLLEILSEVIPKNISVDWAISYVITKDFDIQKFSKVVQFANGHRLTHVRAVSDLLHLRAVPAMYHIRDWMKHQNISDDLVLYQDRQDYSKGQKNCFLSLLKPVIAPDGYLYPCCGVQYALKNTLGVFPEAMRMCHYSNIHEFYKAQKPFDGTKCYKCYYSEYNYILDAMISPYAHQEFV